MNILAPSVLAADFAGLGVQLKEIARAGAKYVHLDVMDGLFVPAISFGMPVIKSIRPVSDLVFDVHLMIQEPIRYIQDFKDCGADILTVHYEACEDVTATLRSIRSHSMKAGLSIKPGTDVSVVRPLLPECDMILLMSVEPGFGGQKFLPDSYGRARMLREMIHSSGLLVDLEIDGGVTLENAQDILDAGVNILVAGSAVFKAPYANTRKFMEILEKDV